MARNCIAAYGDAIVPQIAEAIFRSMRPLFPGATRVLDLFSGAAGGWSLAAEWAGLDVVAGCEFDPWRRQAYLNSHRKTAIFHESECRERLT